MKINTNPYINISSTITPEKLDGSGQHVIPTDASATLYLYDQWYAIYIWSCCSMNNVHVWIAVSMQG